MNNDTEMNIVDEANGDVDSHGHLALALFTGGIIVLLIVIYALAQAA